MKKILPIKYPTITTFPLLANCFAILETNESSMSWICNNFNQICYLRNIANDDNWLGGSLYEFFSKDNISMYAEIPLFKYSKIKKEILDSINVKFVDFLIECINKDYYISTPLNFFHISVSKFNYQKRDFMHPTFIYGYDMDLEIIYFADFLDGKSYDFYTMTFDEANNSYYNSLTPVEYFEEYYEDITLLKFAYNETEIGLKINIDHIKLMLSDYINSTDSTKRFYNTSRWRNYKFSYGLSFYDELIEDIKNKTVRIQSLYSLLDHFKVIEYKVDRLFENKFIEDDETYAVLKNKLNELKISSDSLINTYIKNRMRYGVEKNPQANIDYMVDKYLQIKDKDVNFTQEFINSL